MNKKDLYLQKMKAQLDELQADVEKMKAQASYASADTKLKIIKHLNEVQDKIKTNKKKVAKLAKTSDDAWDTIKEGLETSWDSMKKAVNQAASKFKD